MGRLLQEKTYKNISYRGEVRVNELLPYSQERHLSIQRDWVKFEVSIMTIFHVKRISIEASKSISAELLFEMLSNFLKYECLYDGRFFESRQIMLDGEDVTVELEKEQLSYFGGINSYVQLEQPDDVKTYKTGFCAWEYLSKTFHYPDQMYFMLAYSNGVSYDLKLALFAEALDAFALKLKTDGPVGIDPDKEESTPMERLKELIEEYGDDIFAGDDVDNLLEGLTNSKHKILRLQPFKRGALKPESTEFYCRKIAELYRVIMLGKSGMLNKKLTAAIREEIQQLNEQYAKARFIKTDEQMDDPKSV